MGIRYFFPTWRGNFQYFSILDDFRGRATPRGNHSIILLQKPQPLIMRGIWFMERRTACKRKILGLLGPSSLPATGSSVILPSSLCSKARTLNVDPGVGRPSLVWLEFSEKPGGRAVLCKGKDVTRWMLWQQREKQEWVKEQGDLRHCPFGKNAERKESSASETISYQGV